MLEEKIKKMNQIELLPNDLKLSVLSFLAPKNKQVISGVSTSFKKVVDTLRSGPYYMIGHAINIGKMQYKMGVFSVRLRRDVPAKEIIDSFPTKDHVKLFITQKEAQYYARALRKGYYPGIDSVVSEAAVFSVNIFKRPPPILSEKTLVLKSSCDPLKEPPFFTQVQSFELDVCHVVPRSGSLKVDFNDNGEVTDYGTVNGVITSDKTTFNKCTIL